MARRVIFDPWLLLITAVLVGGGWFMVGSASNYVALEFGKSPSAYGWRHMMHLLLGCGALLAMLSFPYQKLAESWIVRTVVGFSMGTLVFVLSMPEICDARRWIPLGVFNFQPSEFAKLAVVLYMSWVLARKQERVNDLWAVPLPSLLVVGTMALLVVVEPDLGSAVIPVVVACVMIFVAGLRWRYVLGFAGVGAMGFAAAVLVEPYRVARVTSFMNPWADPFDKGYQLCQSLIAFGNGGVTGLGLGGGSQRALFLPAPHTDFIFSVVGEDLGLIGCATVLAAFLLLFWRGLRAAMRAPDRFGFYLALGITCMLVLQGLINMGVCLGLLPTKGLPLPFISYGGSSLLVSMAAMGLLLNVSLHSN
jgi:cell division protein FtsW